MSENTTGKPANGPLPPLTVAEIVAYKTPASLAGWKLIQDTGGGYSFRAEIGGIDYIGTPHEWSGRSLTANLNPAVITMGDFTAYAAKNGVTDLSTQTAGTMQTNDPNISRSLVPKDEMSSSSTAAPAAVVTGSNIHPGILIGVVLVVAFTAVAVVGTIAFFVGRRTNGIA